MKQFIFLTICIALLISCNPKEATSTEELSLGEVDFQVSGNEEAIPLFNEGLLLLHSFEFEDAAEKFVEAQEIDSTFVMAYWGEAMTYNHPLWNERYSEKGEKALSKLGTTPEERASLAQTPIEKDFLNAVEILYSEGDKREIDIAYKNEMERLHGLYPGHNEVAAFYALSLLGSSKSRKEDDNYEQSADVVQKILKDNAQHPGALHYLIHSYDDPEHATFALDAANKYSKIAPDAEHALHMPSHIFVALGMWDEVINSNIASYEASLQRMKNKELDNDAIGYHAFKWLMYGHMQKGNQEEARKLLYDMKQYCNEKPSPKARAHFIMMQANYLVESDNWADSIANEQVELDKLNLLVKGVHLFTQGLTAFNREDRSKLTGTIGKLDSLLTKAESRMIIGSPKMCSGISRNLQPPSVNEVNSLKVLHYELQAYSAKLAGDKSAEEEWLKKATLQEEQTTYTYGPPNIVKPSFELYGEWLLEADRKKEAVAQFNKVLERSPKRLLAVNGLEEAKG